VVVKAAVAALKSSILIPVSFAIPATLPKPCDNPAIVVLP